MKHSVSHMDFARWRQQENREGEPVLRADFSYMKPEDGGTHAKGTAAFLRSLIRGAGGNEDTICCENDRESRHARITGAQNCAIFINWAAKHKPRLIDMFVQKGIFPELSEAAQSRNAVRTPHTQGETAVQEGEKPPASAQKSAIHFADWSQGEKNRQPVLTATFSALGNRQGKIRYDEAKTLLQEFEAMSPRFVAYHDTALSFEIQGSKACMVFSDWLTRTLPEENAAIAAAAAALQRADAGRSVAGRRQKPTQLSFADGANSGWVSRRAKTKNRPDDLPPRS